MEPEAEAPLAARMRPTTIGEFVGQDALIGPGRVLHRAIESDRVPSVILWGPPGSGKTTLAEVIAQATRARFVPMSAVSAGVADLRRAVQGAAQLREFNGEKTILFIDEIHRFNKAQQDAILPHVENGVVTLVGATTENPSFEVNAALLSRCRVFRLERLSDADIMTLVRRALSDRDRGLGRMSIDASDDALERLVRLSDGDARVALTALELAASTAPSDKQGRRQINTETVEDAMQRPALLYDRAGEMHYDLISAFIKSVRGSDPDAAVYWLARMIEAGEDPLFIARRMIILASEDIGLADPRALVLATSCQQAVHFIGMPEGFLPLTECALYLALAPKSNSSLTTYGNARRDVVEHLSEPVPLHLRNAPTGLMRGEGYGRDYRYVHDHAGHYVEQQYLPDELADRRYYEPGTQGFECGLSDDLAARRSEA